MVAAARNAGVDAFFNLGDMSYNQVTPESAWCSLINASAGTMPYELLAGNHEDDGPDGLWSNFASCLPDQLGVSGSYGRQYFVDYPAGAPLVRMIMLSPKLAFPEGSGYWSYKPGTQGYTFAENAIDSARSAGIPFVVVGMHMYCLSMVNYPCYANTDLMNMLVDKHVDLYLQAHDHAYARSKQLALNGSCAALSVTAFNGDCVADADPTSHYVAGQGTVLATVGPGGRSLNKQDPTKAVSAYFQTYMGSNNNPTYGYLQVDVTSTTLTGTFVGASGGTYTDSFTITRSGGASPSPSVSPSASSSVSVSPSASTSVSSSPGTGSQLSVSPVADSWVGSDAASSTHGGDKSLYTDSSPVKASYLKFDLSSLAGREVVGATLQVTTASSSWSGSPDTQRVHAVPDSSWTEAGLSYANAPPFGSAVLGSVTNTSGGGTTYAIPLDITAVQAAVAAAVAGHRQLGRRRLLHRVAREHHAPRAGGADRDRIGVLVRFLVPECVGEPVGQRVGVRVRESVRVGECVGESVCEYVGVVVARDGFAALGVSGGGQLGGQRCRVVHARWRQEPLHRQLAGEGVVPEVRPVVPGGSGGGRCDAAGDHGKQQLERVA